MQAKQVFPTYLFATVQRDRFEHVVEELRKFNEIEFSAPVTGRYDLAIRLKTNNPEQVYSIVNKIRTIHGVNVTNTFIALDGLTNGEKLEGQGIWGFSLLSVNKPIPEVLRKLKNVPSLFDACVVPGQFDIVMSLKAKNYEELMKTSVEQITKIDGICMSETLFASQPYIKA